MGNVAMYVGIGFVVVLLIVGLILGLVFGLKKDKDSIKLMPAAPQKFELIAPPPREYVVTSSPLPESERVRWDMALAPSALREQVSQNSLVGQIDGMSGVIGSSASTIPAIAPREVVTSVVPSNALSLPPMPLAPKLAPYKTPASALPPIITPTKSSSATLQGLQKTLDSSVKLLADRTASVNTLQKQVNAEGTALALAKKTGNATKIAAAQKTYDTSTTRLAQANVGKDSAQRAVDAARLALGIPASDPLDAYMMQDAIAYDGTILSIDNSTASACAKACTATKNCVGFMWPKNTHPNDTMTCMLKNTTKEMRINPDWVSYNLKTTK